jgi:hypothetical protein
MRISSFFPIIIRITGRGVFISRIMIVLSYLFTYPSVIPGQSQAQGEPGEALSDRIGRQVRPEPGGFPQELLDR